MINKIVVPLIFTLLLLFGFTAVAQQENNSEHNAFFVQYNITLPALCTSTEDLQKAQKKETTLFLGILDQSSILRVSQAESGFWAVTLQSANGLSCVFFAGPQAVHDLNKKHKKSTINSYWNE